MGVLDVVFRAGAGWDEDVQKVLSLFLGEEKWVGGRESSMCVGLGSFLNCNYTVLPW